MINTEHDRVDCVDEKGSLHPTETTKTRETGLEVKKVKVEEVKKVADEFYNNLPSRFTR